MPRKVKSKVSQKAKPHRRVKDSIKTVHDVRKAIQRTAPSKGRVVAISTSPSTTPLVAQSISEIQFSTSGEQWVRNSLKITLGSWRFRGNLNVGDRTNLFRLMLVRDKNMNDQAFDPASCFFQDNSGTTVTPVNAQINTRNVEVLYDHTYNLQDSTESVPAVRPSNYFLDLNIPIRRELKFIDMPDGDPAILPRNQTHFYLVSVSDSVILPHPNLSGDSVTWFKNVK